MRTRLAVLTALLLSAVTALTQTNPAPLSSSPPVQTAPRSVPVSVRQTPSRVPSTVYINPDGSIEFVPITNAVAVPKVPYHLGLNTHPAGTVRDTNAAPVVTPGQTVVAVNPWTLVVPFIIPFIIAGVKKLLPNMPVAAIPTAVSPLLGALSDAIMQFSGLNTGGPLVGVLMGFIAVGAREAGDQLLKYKAGTTVAASAAAAPAVAQVLAVHTAAQEPPVNPPLTLVPKP